MGNYTETFTSTTGDTIDASELETQFDDIATAISSKLDSDGSGTMSGDLAMGSNNITGLADPTAAQHAATKAYVDTELNEMVVVGRAAVATTTISTTEVSESEITIAIPTDWTTYDVEISGCGYLDETTTLSSGINITLIVRDGSGTGGTALQTVKSSMYATAGLQNTAAISVFAYQAAETATGNITITLTSQATAESAKVSLTGFNWQVRARRVT
jgi:hypothetical protein|tara:strand:- start:47 stop:694 length:648 start_codon:yes stop_codon:yes gene_type:complete